VNQAGVALTGFLWDYDSSDHHINFAAEATTPITCWRDKVVEWEVELDYKDNGDDSYTCAVDVTVFADLADAPSSSSASEPSTMTAAEVLRAHSPASSAAGPDVRRVRRREGDGQERPHAEPNRSAPKATTSKPARKTRPHLPRPRSSDTS
jgi:hypothetical protein